MKTIRELIEGVFFQLTGNPDTEIANIHFNSKLVGSGDLFVAVKGTKSDGHDYISSAVSQGAVCVVCENMPSQVDPNVCFVMVDNSSVALGYIASNFYDNPSRKLKLVGITGTNGKTSTATLLYRMFRELGHKTGLISTISYFVDDQEFHSTHTTPDSIAINKLLAEMVENNCSHCFMEVSSHAIVQHRITGLEYTGGIFTNLTHDHLDFHLTFRAYLEAKKMFFDNLPASAFALVNIDDKNGSVMVQNTKAGKHSFALKSMATFKASILEHDFSGMQLTMNGHELWTLFIGRFNAYNLLGVYGAACLLEVPSDEALRIISVLQPVDGRFEVIRAKNGKQAIVDYAHTPDALQNVLTTIREARKDSQRIITVAGAGGDRDKLKRPEMARVAASLSDILILTSDNPRSEDPEVILNDMEAGLATEQRTSLYRIADRRSAIRTAIGLASPGDIILVAGKGHETYQEIKGVKHDFDDKLVIQEFIHI